MTPSAPNFVVLSIVVVVSFLFTLSFMYSGCLWGHRLCTLCISLVFCHTFCMSLVYCVLPCDWLYIADMYFTSDVQFTLVIIIIIVDCCIRNLQILNVIRNHKCFSV